MEIDKKIIKFDEVSKSNDVKKFFSNSLVMQLLKIIKQLIFSSIKYIIEIFFCFQDFVYLIKQKNNFSDQNCIILGNGPSLNLIDENELIKFQNNNNKIFAINYWNENIKYKKIIPDYLIITDEKVFLEKEKVFSEILYKKNKNLLDYINRNKNIILIITPKILIKFKNKIKNRYLIFSDSEFDLIYNCAIPIFPRGYASVSAVKALALAKWLNFKNIFLLGMDNSYFKYLFSDKDNKILYDDVHSYNDKIIIDYTKTYKYMSNYIKDHVKVFQAFELFASENNIFNLDLKSLTNCFKKKETDKLNK